MEDRVVWSVRAAGRDDLERVLEVHARHAGVDHRVGRPSADERAAWARMMGTADLTVYLSESGGQPIATATLMVMPNVTYRCAPTAFVEAVVVVPERRREGVATAVMRRVLDDARAAGCNKVQLLSHKRHAEDGAHDLYRSLGFAPEAEGFRLYLGGPPAARLGAPPIPSA